MKKLSEQQEELLFNYLLRINTLLNTAIDNSDDGVIGVDGCIMDDIGILADALKDKIDNIQWV